jgi:hypothetical protein
MQDEIVVDSMANAFAESEQAFGNSGKLVEWIKLLRCPPRGSFLVLMMVDAERKKFNHKRP